MKDIKILDLISQKDIVKSVISGSSKEESLNWLKTKGELKEVESGVENTAQVYCFKSSIGIEALIFFHKDELTFVSDHGTF